MILAIALIAGYVLLWSLCRAAAIGDRQMARHRRGIR